MKIAPHSHGFADFAPVARAAYKTGYAYENQIATWCHEAGATPHQVCSLLIDAGTPLRTLPGALHAAGYTEEEIELFDVVQHP